MRIRRTCVAACLLLLVNATGCGLVDADYLEREPVGLLTDDQVWNDAGLVDGALANLYGRLPTIQSLEGPYEEFAYLDEAMWSGRADGPNTRSSIPVSFWNGWNYTLIRDLNIFIEKIATSEELPEKSVRAYAAEARFLRAYVYFDLVKRMGGVPIVTELFEYDNSGDPAYLQFPRNTEAEVYDFIGAEIDAIVSDLPSTTSQTRANRWTALAMKSRAMLYAGSLAKYNSQMEMPIQLRDGIVGIPAARAQGYFEQSLAAAQEIIDSGKYSLYNVNPDKKLNFYEALTKKQNNPEMIWAQDYDGDQLYQQWTYYNMPASMGATGIESAAISPSLNLVESFERLDGSSGEVKTRDGNGDFIYYDQPEDIFAGRDARLWGTVIYPGAEFRGQEVSVQAGVLAWNVRTQKYDTITSGALGATYKDGGLLVGRDGPLGGTFSVTNTGFHVRKFMDPMPGTEELNIGSAVWWPRYRYAEVLLNATEAAFELGRTSVALTYVNQVRDRAGFGPNSLSSLTMERIRNERRVELAFEDHRLYDMKRWRLADQTWNGESTTETAVIYALWPYRVARPGDPRNNKYVFVKKPAPRVTNPRLFGLGNYYSQIPQGVLDANPKIIKNPFH